MHTLATVAVSPDQVPPSARTNAPSVLFVDQSGQLGGAEFSLMPLAATWGARREVLLLSDLSLIHI